MAFDYTTTTFLVPSVKRHALIPLAASTFTATDFIAFLNEALLSLSTLLAKERQGYFVRRLIDVPLVAGQDSYPVPERALGAVLQDVGILEVSGQVRDLTYLTPSDAVGSETDRGPPDCFFMEGSNVVVRPVPDSTGESLRLPILERPNALVASAQVGINTAPALANTFSMSAGTPVAFTTSTPLDIIEGRQPFRTLARSITPTVVGPSSCTFASGVLPSTLAFGDFLSLAGESHVAQIPDVFLSSLTLMACASALDSLDQSKKAQAKQKEAEQKLGAALAIVRPRVKQATRVMPNGMDKWRTEAPEERLWWRA
jgi:hypothetical protein